MAPAGIPRWLHNRLRSLTGSLVDCDLTELSEGLEGRAGHPVAVLFDILQRPNADIGQQLPSLLEWRHVPDRAVSHILVGRGPAGGVLANEQNGARSLSSASWMDLPGFSLGDWRSASSGLEGTERVPLGDFADYYKAYAHATGIADNMLSYTTIESSACTHDGWVLRGVVESPLCSNRLSIQINAASVIAATGVFDVARSIKFDAALGDAHDLVVHAYGKIKDALSPEAAVVVVGGGLSAADAVLDMLARGNRVYHVFRSPAGVLDRLPASEYPEYARLAVRMTEGAAGGYTPLPGYHVERVAASEGSSQGCEVALRGPSGDAQVLSARHVLVSVGSEASLAFLPEEIVRGEPAPRAARPIQVDPATSQWPGTSTLFAVGSLAGGQFVRFMVGSCAAAVSTLFRNNVVTVPPRPIAAPSSYTSFFHCITRMVCDAFNSPVCCE